MQDKVDERFYATTLQFTHDLCRAVNIGINTEIKPPSADETGVEAVEASPSKQSNNYADARDRRRLGKRILKTVQPQLEAALKAESDICGKPLDALLKELEGMIEASLEIRQPTITVSHDETGAAPKQRQDVEMTDAPEEAQIIVADHSEGEPDASMDGEQHDADADADGEPDDPMDTDVPLPVRDGRSNIEVNTFEHEDDASSKPNGTFSSDVSAAGEQPRLHQQPSALTKKDGNAQPVNGFTKVDSGSPPSLSAFGAPALQPPQHSDPLTPPQSNGSFGRDTANILTEGGVPWYLQGFDLRGTSAVEEQWTGREALRSLSEELTDMDDDALKDLEFDVDDDTITASPVNAENGGSGGAGAGAGNEAKVAVTPGRSAKKRERANPAKFRKGVRSSARRR